MPAPTIHTPWTEEQLLDEFWKAQEDLGVDRLQLLRLYAMVVVGRPAEWTGMTRGASCHSTLHLWMTPSVDSHETIKTNGLHSCGSCGKAIGKGQLVATTRTGLERCEPCGRLIEEPPDTIADETDVPTGVKYQASLGFGSAGEMAGRHLANHLRVRSER